MHVMFSTNWAKGFGIHVVDVVTGEERRSRRCTTGCARLPTPRRGQV